MRIVLFLLAIVSLPIAALAGDGTLDPDFGNGGIVEIGWPAGAAQANAIGADSAQRILVGGSAIGPHGDRDFALFRLLPDGLLDTTYALEGSGFRLIDFDLDGIGSHSDDVINDLTVHADGSVTGLGEAHFGFAGVNSQFALARVDGNGDLDSTFGQGGTLHFGFANFGNIDQGSRLVVDGSGNIVVTGTTVEYFSVNTPLEYWFGLTRLTPDGLLDSSFYGGLHPLTFWVDPGPPHQHSKKNFPYALALDNFDRIVVAGATADPIDQDAAAFRAQPDGDFDTTFGQYSRIRLDLPYAVASALLSTTNGKMLIAGGCGAVPAVGQLFLARVNEDGSPDYSFGTNGTGSIQLAAGFPLPSLIAVTGKGGWLVAGPLTDGIEYFNTAIVLARFDANGNPDYDFGKDGIVVVEGPDGRPFNAGRFALQPDGKLIVAGGLPNIGPDVTPHFAIMRILIDHDAVFADGFDGG